MFKIVKDVWLESANSEMKIEIDEKMADIAYEKILKQEDKEHERHYSFTYFILHANTKEECG